MTIRTRRILAVIGAACAIGPVVWMLAVATPPMWVLVISSLTICGIGIADRQIMDPSDDDKEDAK